MQTCDQLLSKGYSLRASLGEVITFRSVQIRIPRIARDPDPVRDAHKIPDFSQDIGSIAELPLSLSTAPAVGESFVDRFGKTHLIRTFRNGGEAWIVGCNVAA